MSDFEVSVNGRKLRIAPGSTAAAALWNTGETAFRTSVSGAPRGPLCAMGTCFECRATIDGVEHRRSCLDSGAEPAKLESDRFDIAVAGGGPAGIAAAVRASEAGKRVVVLDSGARAGGQIWRGRFPRAAPGRRREVARRPRTLPRRRRDGRRRPRDLARIPDRGSTGKRSRRARRGTRRAGERRPRAVPSVSRLDASERLRNRRRAGAREVRRVVPGKRVVLAGSGPLLLPAAATLSKGGANVVLVAEQAPAARIAFFAAGLWRSPRLWADAARYRRAFAPARYAPGTWAVEAQGKDRISEVLLTNGRRRWTEACDVLCTGYGLVPNTELARLLGCEMDGEAVTVDALQETSVPGVFCAGEPTGVGGVDLAILEGEIAGACAAGEAPPDALLASRLRLRGYSRRLDRAFRLRSELREMASPDTIVCRCEDVRLGELDPAWSPRQAKLYTRAGMGPCQGRVCGPALAFHFGWGPDRVQFPVFPASIRAMIETLDSEPRKKENE